MTTSISGTSGITFPDGTQQSTAGGVGASAKAWVTYNGIAGTILAGFNVGSVTKNSAGNYTFNFTAPMPDANYAITTALVGWDNGGACSNFGVYGQKDSGPVLKTSSQVRMIASNTQSNTPADFEQMYFAVYA